jgi:predicted phage tail protein
LSKDLDTKVREHNKIREQINIFKDKLGKGEANKGEGEPKELTPDDIANKLKEKEESIQDVEMKTYDEEQKLDELKKEYTVHQEKKNMLEGPKLEGAQPVEDLSKTMAIKVSKIDQTRLETMKGEFEQVRKEINEIMSKFKGMQLARVLKVQSEMEGIEFNWNN